MASSVSIISSGGIYEPCNLFKPSYWSHLRYMAPFPDRSVATVSPIIAFEVCQFVHLKAMPAAKFVFLIPILPWVVSWADNTKWILTFLALASKSSITADNFPLPFFSADCRINAGNSSMTQTIEGHFPSCFS